MNTIIVLAMHGAIPKNFPQDEKIEFLKLHSQIENIPESQRVSIQDRHDELDKKMREWPRTIENDKFHFSSNQIAEALSKESGNEVVVGYNEFCSPDLKVALRDSASRADQVLVMTPMMTQGGIHSEVEIPEEIEKVKLEFPDKQLHYVWPFEVADIAHFFTDQIKKFENTHA